MRPAWSRRLERKSQAVWDNYSSRKDDEVSGEHGKIVFNGAGHVYYYDLESTNGSWVNDVQVEEGKRYPKPLLEGHRIKLGPKTVLGVFETDVNGIEEFN